MNKSIERIYHPYHCWEETEYNMWGRVEQGKRQEYLDRAIQFTGEARVYGAWMLRVTEKWKYSCEHNLSDTSQNRKAWIGHAACALAFQCPEDIVREAWKHLSERQQIEANAVADLAIALWESRCSEISA